VRQYLRIQRRPAATLPPHAPAGYPAQPIPRRHTKSEQSASSSLALPGVGRTRLFYAARCRSMAGLSVLGRRLKRPRKNCQAHGQGQNTDATPAVRTTTRIRLVWLSRYAPRPSRPHRPRKAPQRGSRQNTRPRPSRPRPASMPETGPTPLSRSKWRDHGDRLRRIVPLGLAALTTPLWCAPHSNRARPEHSLRMAAKRPKLPAHGYRPAKVSITATPPRRRLTRPVACA